ncbi:MAG: hypothetical protein ACUVTM_00670 [Candidatus Bathyarchaeia archaeon]
MRMLTTLTQPSCGTARVAGYDIRRQADEARKRIELVAENG